MRRGYKLATRCRRIGLIFRPRTCRRPLHQNKRMRDQSIAAHLSLVYVCFHNRLRIPQHRDTIEINAVCEVTRETEGQLVDTILNSPVIRREELTRNEAREVTLVDGPGRGRQIQQFIIKSRRGLRPIVEER